MESTGMDSEIIDDDRSSILGGIIFRHMLQRAGSESTHSLLEAIFLNPAGRLRGGSITSGSPPDVSAEDQSFSLHPPGNQAEEYTPNTNIAMSVINKASQATTTNEQPEIGKQTERTGIQRFADDVPWLMKGLDELAQIHPVVTVAVSNYKVAYVAKGTRQENNRRVMNLYVEMTDMMVAMVRLIRCIDNCPHIRPNGCALKDLLKELAGRTANDIRECGRFCDTFRRKNKVAKVLLGFVWTEKLVALAKVFSDRKEVIHLALSAHTANPPASSGDRWLCTPQPMSTYND